MRALSLLTFLLIVSFTYAAPGQIHYVKPLQAKFYSSPSDTADVQFVLAIGRKLVEFDSRSGWLNVGVGKSGGLDGWIRAEDVSPTDPDGLKY